MSRSGPSVGGRAGRAAVMSAALWAGVVACSSRDDTGASGSDDQRQLNAAALLDSNSIDANAFGAHESSAHD